MFVMQMPSWFPTSIYNIFPRGSPILAGIAPVTGSLLLLIPPGSFLESALCESGLPSPELTHAVPCLPAGVRSAVLLSFHSGATQVFENS